MPVQGTITLNSIAYNSRGTSNGISTWVAPAGGLGAAGPSTLTESVRGPLSDGGTKVRWVLDLPKLADSDSTCACEGTLIAKSRGDIQITIPPNLTAAERQDLVDRLQALVALSVFDVSVSGPEGSWG